MNNADINTTLVESYFSLLERLSPNNKLELISKLSNSLQTENSKNDNSWKSLFGALEIDQTADDFVADLKRERNFRSKSVEF
jgi:hypothetical protein